MSGAMSHVPSLSADFGACLGSLPDGYSQGDFQGQRWGVTVRRGLDGRRLWLYGEELGGKDIVSFNLYSGVGGRHLLKPCEMSSTKVVEFVLGFRPDGRGVRSAAICKG